MFKQFSFRLNESEYKKLCDDITASGMKNIEYIKMKIFGITIEKKKYNKSDLKMIRKKKTELHYNLYHVSNTLETIFKIAKKSFIVSRGKNINMKSVNRVILESKKVYDAMPKQDKKIIADDMKYLLELKDIENLKRVLFINKLIEMVENKDMRIDMIPSSNFNMIEKVKK